MEKYLKAAQVWSGMKARCYNSRAANYADYGGRGIYIDKSWLQDPDSFVLWYVERFFEKCHVDRIDNDGPYSENNCRLVTPRENNKNRRNTVLVSAWGETKTCSEWISDPRSGKRNNSANITTRIKAGMTPEEAISLPISEIRGQQPMTPVYLLNGVSKTLLEWSYDSLCKVPYKLLHGRVVTYGWPLEKAMTTPHRKDDPVTASGYNINELVKRQDCVVGYGTLQNRLEKGWDIEAAVTTPGRGTSTLYEGKTLSEWSRDSSCEVKLGTLRARIDRGGWPLEKALKK